MPKSHYLPESVCGMWARANIVTLSGLLLLAACEAPVVEDASRLAALDRLEPMRLGQPFIYPVDDLFRVRDVVRSGDEVLVFETRDPRVRRLGDTQLIEERTLLGNGPGEYREITSVSVGPGDSLAVFDASVRRVSILTATGEYARSVRLSGSDRPILGQLRWTQDGWIVEAGSQVVPGQEVGSWRPTHEILRFALDGSFIGVVRSLPGPEVFFGEAGGFVLPIVARRSSWDALGDMLILSDGMTVIQKDLATGSETKLALGLGPKAPLSTSEHETFLDSLAVGMSHIQRGRLSATYGITSLPSELPVVGEVRGSRDGVVWISEYADPRSEHRRWLRLDVPTGELLGSVLLPTGADLLYADREVLLVLDTDRLGIERILRFPLPMEAS